MKASVEQRPSSPQGIPTQPLLSGNAFATSHRNASAQPNAPGWSQRKNTQRAAMAATWSLVRIAPWSKSVYGYPSVPKML
jgi:hypothetical protein